MSVIQQIQEKYAKLMAIIIAIALITFVVMLAFENGGSLFNQNSTTVGAVNGEKIEYESFRQLVDRQETNMKTQGYGSGEAITQQAISASWNQEVNRLLMSSEFDKLGMGVGKKELGDILYGANPPEDLKQQFTSKETGVYDAPKAKAAVDGLLKSGTPEQIAQMSAYIDQLEFNRINEKYTSLLISSSNYPRWQAEKENADNSQIAKISFVREVYASISDSTIKITDKEIEDYINKHKDDYKQEESRSIAYVSFSALPTTADSLAAKDALLALKPSFDTTKNIQEFLESQGVQTFYDGYINGSRLQVPAKDSIIKIPIGAIYGPYLDGGNYSLAKMVDKRTQPDTVKVRHILVGTSQRDPQTGQSYPTRDTATAYKLADSIRIAIQNGSNFDSLCIKFSDDQGKNDQQTGQYTGGIYDNVPSGKMVPSFNDFIFGKPAGTKGIVKTDFGYHYIEVLSQKGSSTAYKIAYLPTPISASNETDNAARNEATKFAGDSRNQKLFDANAEKLKARGITKLLAADILPDAYQVQGVGLSRSFVKSIYSADLGEVVQPERVGDNYVVAIVTATNKKGTKNVATARPLIEPLLRNHKKAEQLIKKLGNATTLEAAALAWGGKPVEVADSIRLSLSEGQQEPPIVASEPKIIGAAFNPANKGKVSTPIEGTSGVYVIRVDNISATSVGNANIAAQRQSKFQQAKMRGTYAAPQNVLKEAATVKDYRNKFY